MVELAALGVSTTSLTQQAGLRCVVKISLLDAVVVGKDKCSPTVYMKIEAFLAPVRSGWWRQGALEVVA